MIVNSSYTSESGHWYTKDGEPAYTIIGKNGKERNTTLRDARKEGLLPSVTTIIKLAAAPGLEQWKQRQVLLSALTLPKIDGESEDSYIARIMADSKEQGRKAAELGTKIHGAIESSFMDGTFNPEYSEHVMAAQEEVRRTFGNINWGAEKSFGSVLGYGGKIDLSSMDDLGVVIDFKTKEFTADKLPECYDEHIMQLGAYREGIGRPLARCANVFISTSVPGLAHTVEHEGADLYDGFQMFKSLLRFWKLKTGYHSEF